MSDRKYKYGEKTVLVSGFRVPISKVQDFKDSAYAKLDSYINESKLVSEVKLDSLKSIKADFKKIKSELDSMEVIEPEFKTEKPTSKKDYEYLDKLPFSQMVQVIGHKCHKHLTEEIYYVKPPDEKGLRVVVLYSEKEVKDFIRKEIVK